MLLYSHFDINEQGHLTVGGLDTVQLAKQYGTPVNLLDENAIRAQMRLYLRCAKQYFGESALPLFASKALCCAEIYRIAAEEGMGIDCVSPGELYIAERVGFPAERIYFHGNNKTDADLAQALDMGVGTFVVDNREELDSLNAQALGRGIRARILLRITPGIDPHTHKAISTGGVDSKFGSPILTGQAEQMVLRALECPGIDLQGLHCHIGSQIFDAEPFVEAAQIMVAFMADMIHTHGAPLHELNLGGGLGVRYTEEQPTLDIEGTVRTIAQKVKTLCTQNGIDVPRVILPEDVPFFLESTDRALQNMASEPVHYVDYIYRNANVDPNQILEIAELDGIWGKDVEESFVAIDGLKVTADMVTVYVKKNNTLKITLPNRLSIMLFNAPDDLCEKLQNTQGYVEIDIIGKPNKNEYNGWVSPQIFIEEYAITGESRYNF